jgi:hypothetical protein
MPLNKPRLSTLTQITGERPRCQYCRKELTPRTQYVRVDGHITSPPTTDELLTMNCNGPSRLAAKEAIERFGYMPERVFRLIHKTSFVDSPCTEIHFLTDKFDGYGFKDLKLFCNNDCGRLFGIAAWAAGYRIKVNPDEED